MNDHLAGKSMSPALKERFRRLKKQRSSPLSKPQKDEKSPHSLDTPTHDNNWRFGNSSKNQEHSPLDYKEKKLATVQQIPNIECDEINNKDNLLDENEEIHVETSEEALEAFDEIKLQEVLKAKQKSLSVKQDLLRRLKLVKMYRTKNDPTELTGLITKWREVSQQALHDLRDKMPDPKPTLSALLRNLNIDPKMLNYSEEDEDFVT